MLRFCVKPNRKLKKLQTVIGKRVRSFDLPSGHSCPFARDCASRAVEVNGTRKVVDGPDCKFRCYSASQEAFYPATFAFRQENLLALKECRDKYDMASLLLAAIPNAAEVIRIHASGDFFNRSYFDAWLKVAWERSDLDFYCYTKAIQWTIAGRVPDNLTITLSYGGTQDHLIPEAKELGYHTVEVVQEPSILVLDEDDSHAYYGTEDFALLVHGVQPARARL